MSDEKTCEETGLDDEGERVGDACNELATHYSCMYWGGSKDGPNVCKKHKCRCKHEPVAPKATPMPGAAPVEHAIAESYDSFAPELIEGVAVLYVDPFGPYPGMVRQWYDETRDAKTYAGPWPVVAHPPCGPWGRLKFLCTKQDPSAGPHGVAMVQRWGGVLEHPEHSTLFRHCNLPRPGELADAFGGRTYAVRQVAWGHPCEKRTWLYVVGVEPAVVIAGLRTEGRPTHRVTNGSRGDTSLPRANAETNRRSPPAFARWLIELASAAQAPRPARKDGDAP